MTNITTTPRVWIGCLAAYNAGHLHGEWTDATDADELREVAERVIKTSPADFPEEIFLADNEGFGGLIGEYESLDRVAALGEAIEEHGEPFIAFVNLGTLAADADVDELVEGFTESYRGEFDSEEAFAEQTVSELGWGGLEQIPDELFSYLDFEKIARDLTMSGQYVFVDGYVFESR